MDQSAVVLYRLEVVAGFVFWFGAASTMLVGLVDPLVSLAISSGAVLALYLAKLVFRLRRNH
jgi:hypothetical protein